MPTRAFHHKSRHGCRSCKSRRKRCDRQNPRCSECDKQNLQCVYDGPFVLHTSSSHAVSLVPRAHALTSAASTLDPFLQALLRAGIPHIEVSDLEMMRLLQFDHSAAFNSLPALRAIRNLNLLRIAPACPYLLHGLLAASAWYIGTQLDRNTPNASKIKWLEGKTVEHQQFALESYTLKLSAIDDTTCQSIFGFSVMLASLEFALINRYGVDPGSDGDQCLEDLIRVFRLLQGAVAVANASSAWIPGTRAEPLLLPIRSSLNFGGELESQDVLNALDTLDTSLCNAEVSDIFAAEFSPIRESMICDLRKAFLCLERPEPYNFLGVVGWSAFLDPRYVALIQVRNPIALLVTAYYGAALHALDHVWWLRGVGARVVTSIATALDACDTVSGRKYRLLMRWPEMRVRKGTANLCLNASGNDMVLLRPSYARSGTIFEKALVGTHTVEVIGGVCPIHLSAYDPTYSRLTISENSHMMF